MITKTQLQQIVDGYFTENSTKPLHSYNAELISQVIINAGNTLITKGQQSFYDYIKSVAEYYGIDISKAIDYVNENGYYKTIINYYNENHAITSNGEALQNLVAAPFKFAGNAIGDAISGLLKPILKNIIPILLIIAVLYFSFKYIDKKI
jgi:hypothetical protein